MPTDPLAGRGARRHLAGAPSSVPATRLSEVAILALRVHQRAARAADALRADPMFKLALDRLPSDDELCSQSTISRLENLPDVRALLRLGQLQEKTPEPKGTEWPLTRPLI